MSFRRLRRDTATRPGSFAIFGVWAGIVRCAGLDTSIHACVDTTEFAPASRLQQLSAVLRGLGEDESAFAFGQQS